MMPAWLGVRSLNARRRTKRANATAGGVTRSAPGCANCYAEGINDSSYFGGNHLPYSGQPPVLKLREDLIDGWARQKKTKNRRRGRFCGGGALMAAPKINAASADGNAVFIAVTRVDCRTCPARAGQRCRRPSRHRPGGARMLKIPHAVRLRDAITLQRQEELHAEQ